MEIQNQDYLIAELEKAGLSPEEIQIRLMRLKMSTSNLYDPLQDCYKDEVGYKPINAFKSDAVNNIKVTPSDDASEAENDSNVPPLPTPVYVSPKVGMFVVKSAYQTLIEASERPDPKSLYKGLWYEGELCCLFADSYVGKSLYAVQIGTAISRNERVLYFDFELSEKMFQIRYTDDISKDLYHFPDNFFRVSVDPNELAAGQDFESEVIKNIEETSIEMDAKCLIVDNLTWLCQSSEKSEAATALMKDLWSLTRKHSWSILVLSHTPKRNLSNPITQNDLSGSKRLFNFFDGCFAIGKSARNESQRYIKQLKVRSGLLEYHADNVILCEIKKNGAFTFFEHIGYGNEKEMLRELESEDQRLMNDAICELAAQGKSYQQIADELGTNKTKVCRVLQRRGK